MIHQVQTSKNLLLAQTVVSPLPPLVERRSAILRARVRFPSSAMQYTFSKDVGAAVRENVARAPGPGHYNMHPGVGKQVCV